MLRIGPAGWSYKDWNGTVYPEPRPPDFDELAFIAERFNCIELNNTFYRPAAARMSESWARRTPDGFVFTAKLWQRFTHEADDWGDAEVATYRDGLAPLREAGKLGAVLAQFAWSFRDGGASRDRLRRIADAFRDAPLVVEVRHVSWADAPSLFRELGIGWCNVDQPASATSIQGTAHVTSSVAYVRLHGRNAKAWFTPGAGRDDKYNYLYSEAEIGEWVEKTRRMDAEAEQTYVIANNHFRGQAVTNAVQLMLAMRV